MSTVQGVVLSASMLKAQYNSGSPTVTEGASGLGLLNGKQNMPGSQGPSRHDGAVLYEFFSSSIVLAQRKSCSACSAEFSALGGEAVAGGFANIAGP